MNSTPLIAFDQHAATTVAAVLLPGQQTPALHSLTSETATILRFVKRMARHAALQCCYEAAPCDFALQRALTQQGVPCDIIAPALISRRPGREDIRADLLRAHHRLSKFLLRHRRRFTATKRAWSKRHETWLRVQTWPLRALDQAHRAYLRAVEETVVRLRAVEEDLRALLTLEPLQARVQRRRCFRGIDDLTALTIAAELGDARRFATAPRTMAFVG
jgi:transposase